MEEIENSYGKEVEILDKEFLEKIKQPGKNAAELEKEYLIKLRKATSKYEKAYVKFLKESKGIFIKEKQNPEEKKDKKVGKLKTKPFDLRTTRRAKLKKRWSLFKFKFGIKKRNFFRKITPNFLSMTYLRLRVKLKWIIFDIKGFLGRTWAKLKGVVRKLLHGFKVLILKILSFIKKVIVKIFGLIKKILKNIFSKFRGKKEEGREKRPEDDIVNKILKESKEE